MLRSRGALVRLLAVARPYWPHLLACLIVSLGSIPLALLTPLPLRIAVDNVLGAAPLAGWMAGAVPSSWAATPDALLWLAIALMLITVLLMQLQSLGNALLDAYVGQRLVLAFRARLFHHGQRLSLTYHDSAGTTDATYRIQYDAPAIEHVLVTGLIPLLVSALTLVGMIVVTLQMDATLAMVALGVVPAICALTAIFGQRLKERWTDLWGLDSKAMAVVHETLAALRVVKAFGSEDREQQRFERQAGEVARRQFNLAFLHGAYDLLVALTLGIGSVAGLYVGVGHVQSGVLTLGQLLVVMAYLAMLYEPLNMLTRKFADLQSGLASAQRAFALLDEAPEVIEQPHARTLARARGAIEFRAVAFTYSRGASVLQDVSFAVRPGSRVGVEGMSGAGKSTLMSLLVRFYDPTGGRILLDGVDLREYRLRDLRAQFSIVLQESVLFSTTIAENIGYGRPGASDDEIMQAARLANAHDFIAAFPDAYQTPVGERGIRLSGGERQRIALARAFLRNAPILVLDEPTSAIDIASEEKIIDATERLMCDRTTFIIAHRPSTLAGCDVRLRVYDGKVVDLAADRPAPAGEAAAAPVLRDEAWP
ncbi:MAG: ABC transporter ATP-binding protein [Burkholderiales bacterium]|nr:ABC transporter ATP-binding protein [Burkholderiales bacterium]